MQRGGKKSPFLGRTERIESASQLLYPRYTALSDAVLYPEGSILPVSPTQTKAGIAVPVPQTALPAPVQAQPVVQLNRQPLFRTALQPTTVSEIASPEQDAKPKRPKKKRQKVEEDPAAKISGPSNAEEAQLMRSVLGFAPAAPVSTPGTPTPQPAAPTQAQVQQQAAVPQSAAHQTQQTKQAQQAQQAQQTQQAHQPNVQHTVAHQQQQQQQTAPIQPQQQSTFRFGFAAEQPADTPPANGTLVASAAALAPSQQAPQAVTQQAGPTPVGAAEPAPQFVARRVFVGGMPFTYEIDAIREYWGYCGEIEDLDVMRFPDTGRFKGIAFITYATEEGYEEALKCDGTDLDGQQLRVQKCMSAGQHGAKKKQAPIPADATAPGQQQQQVQQQPAAPKVAGYYVAYVGNLAFEAGDEEVQGLFPDCNVTKVRLHTDKATGKSRGFAHVHFLDEASLDKAMQFNGAPLHGRQVKVSFAQRKR